MSLLKVDLPNINPKIYRNCILLFLVLCFLLFGKSISNRYAMDDEFVTLNNSVVMKGIKGIPEIFRTSYSYGNGKENYEYRPIVKVTYAIEYQLFGANPYISHFINILLYFLTMWLLFYILLKLFHNYHYVFPLLVVLLFLIHPVHSEVVMSLKNRDGILSFFFCLISIGMYMRFATGRGYIYLVWGFLFLFLGCISKRDLIPFVGVIPFIAWFFMKADWKKMLTIFMTFFPVLFMFKALANSVDNEVSRTMLLWENPLFINSTFWSRIPQGLYCIYFYVKMFLFPYPLISYYGYNQVPIVGWSDPIVWIMLLLMLFVLYLVIRFLKSKPVWLFGIIYFIATISMFTNVLKPVVGIVGERFLYIPSLGLCITAVYFLLKYTKVPFTKPEAKIGAFDNKLWIITGAIVLVFGGYTFSRNAAWKDAYTLYKTDVQHATESAHSHSLLAAAAVSKIRQEPRLSQKDKRELVKEAEDHYLESLRIIPDYISSLNNLGMVYYTFLNNPQKAIPLLEKATRLDTGYVEANYNLATCYAAINRFDEAEKAYKRSIELNPDFTASYTSLSNMYAHNKQFDKIIKFNEDAIKKGVKNDAPYINIGNVYFMNGDTVKALPYLEKAIEVNWNNKGVNTFLANYYQSKGNSQKASYYYSLLSKIPK